jgi:hypothetical protein
MQLSLATLNDWWQAMGERNYWQIINNNLEHL